MKNLYIILVEPNEAPILMREKISNAGDCYRLYDSYVLFSDIQSAEELYKFIVGKDYDTEEIVIFKLLLDKTSFFGYTDRGLWEWLSENIV